MRLMSGIHGRIRVQDNRLKNTERLTEWVEEMCAIPGVQSVSTDSRIGTAIIFFDTSVHSQETLYKRLTERLNHLTYPKLEKAHFKRKSLQLRNRQLLRNHKKTFIHSGLSSAMGLTLGSILFGNKHIHFAAGATLVGFSLIHVIENRNKLFASLKRK